MSHGMKSIDTHVAKEMAWHQKTTIVDKVTRDNAFPAEPRLERLYAIPSEAEFLKVLKESKSAEETVAHFMRKAIASDYSQPFASDVSQFIGVPANPETYTFRSPQNAMDDMMDATNGELEIVSALTLKSRSRYSISAKVNGMNPIKVGGRDFQPFLTLSGAMDKSTPEVWGFSTTDAVCQNTLAIALLQMVNKAIKKGKQIADSIDLGSAQRFAQMRHSKGMHSKLEQTKLLLESALFTAGLFGDTLKALLKRPVRLGEAKAIYLGFLEGYTELEDSEFNALLDKKPDDLVSTRRKNEVEGLGVLFARGLGNKGETQIDLLSGFTERFTRGQGDLMDDDAKVKLWQSSEGGLYANQKSDFFTLLQQPSKLELTAKRGELILDRIGGLASVLPDLIAKPVNSRSLNAQVTA